MITDIGREIERKRERDRERKREKPHIEKERDL